jgi:hypothetical protein
LRDNALDGAAESSRDAYFERDRALVGLHIEILANAADFFNRFFG